MNARSFGKRFGCVGVVVVALVLLAAFSSAMELFWTRIDQRRFPWAYEESGRPTLIGLWVGSLTYLGFFFGNIPWIKGNLTAIILGIIAVSLLPLVIAFVKSRTSKKS